MTKSCTADDRYSTVDMGFA